MSVGESPFGVEPPEKGMGVAGHTAANAMPQALTAHIVHSTIAHGAVLHMDVSGALNVPGVVRILTCFDVPDRPFPAGGPWLAREARQERTERLLLNRHVRVWGDEIAVVLAQSESAARRAAALIEVEYERFPILMTPEAAMAKEAPAIHEQYPDNVLSHSSYVMGTGTYQETATSGGLIRLEKSYRTQTTRHCPAEPGGCLAYREHDCVVVITDTPIPNLVHHVIAQATGLAWGSIQIIKPENGVGLHHQQRVIYEPLAAWLTIQMGGRPVRLELSREEAFMGTRTCHAVDFTLCAAVHADGRLAARRLEAWSHQGGYAPSGHSIARNAAAGYCHLYQDERVLEADAYTIFTNLTTGCAVRGEGIAQINFAMECQMDDLARLLYMDPIALRKRNCIEQGKAGMANRASALRSCMELGRTAIGWEEKRAAYAKQTGLVRRGVGMALFGCQTDVESISFGTDAYHMVLKRDGSMQLQMSATELEQWVDTAFAQRVADAAGLRLSKLHPVPAEDVMVHRTDARGMALVKAAHQFKAKVLAFAADILLRPVQELDLADGVILCRANGERLLSVGEVALEAGYRLTGSQHAAEREIHSLADKTVACGASFAEVEVDLPAGKVQVLRLMNVYDSGRLTNRPLAEAQAKDGMSRGLGDALGAPLLYDENACPCQENPLKDQGEMALVVPQLTALFLESDKPIGSCRSMTPHEQGGIAVPAAVRNAILHATGIAMNQLPMNPKRLNECFAGGGQSGHEKG